MRLHVTFFVWCCVAHAVAGNYAWQIYPDHNATDDTDGNILYEVDYNATHNNSNLSETHSRRYTYSYMRSNITVDHYNFTFVNLSEQNITVTDVECASRLVTIPSVSTGHSILDVLNTSLYNNTVVLVVAPFSRCQESAMLRKVISTTHVSDSRLEVVTEPMFYWDVIKSGSVHLTTSQMLRQPTSSDTTTRQAPASDRHGPAGAAGKTVVRPSPRGWFSSLIKSAWSTVTNAVQTVVSTAVSTISTVVTVAAKIVDFVFTGDLEGSTTFDIFDTSYSNTVSFADDMLTLEVSGEVEVDLTMEIEISSYTLSSFQVSSVNPPTAVG